MQLKLGVVVLLTVFPTVSAVTETERILVIKRKEKNTHPNETHSHTHDQSVWMFEQYTREVACSSC